MLVLSLAACGKQDTDDGVKKFYNSMNDTTEAVGESTQSGLKAAAEENGKSVKKSSDILIVSDINSANETIRVYNYSTGVQYQYYYGLTTGFFDKYGNHMSVSDIHQGDVVDISGADSDGKAKRIQKSDKVWTNDAGRTRLRPILMTAMTTILAMFTSAIGIGDGSDMIKPMAIAIIGGLVYGTILTLIVIPCIYDAFNREKSMVEEEL